MMLALVFISILGNKVYQIILALGIIFIPSFARIVRGEFIRQKELDYVKSARLMGAGHFRIMFFHILPNTLPALLSAITVGFNNAVLAEAQGYLFSAPWYALYPGVVIILLILGFSLINEGLGA